MARIEFKCQICSVGFYRNLNGQQMKGEKSMPRYCSAACYGISKRAIVSAYYTGYCGCGVALGSKLLRETKRCEQCSVLDVARRAEARERNKYRQAELEPLRARWEALRLDYRSPISETCCSECGVRYSILFGAWRGAGTSLNPVRMPTCSASCQRRRSARARKAGKWLDKVRRRAREKAGSAELVDPIRVLERDGWKCYACVIDTPKELRGTYEPNAPEVDHVIPITKGGDHTYTNTRCMCRQCNGDKSDRVID